MIQSILVQYAFLAYKPLWERCCMALNQLFLHAHLFPITRIPAHQLYHQNINDRMYLSYKNSRKVIVQKWKEGRMISVKMISDDNGGMDWPKKYFFRKKRRNRHTENRSTGEPTCNLRFHLAPHVICRSSHLFRLFILGYKVYLGQCC
jgi:hypothetical protein